MDRLPFGVERFDSIIDGGAPSGSTVLLASEVGAGGRGFAYTSAAMNGLALAAPDQFERYYGHPTTEIALPEAVHYLTFTNTEDAIHDEMQFTLAEEVVADATDALTVTDLANEFFRKSPVPRDWYSGRSQSLDVIGDSHGTTDVFDAIGETLKSVPNDSLLIVDSITDLIAVADEELSWDDVTLLLKGLDRIMQHRGGMLLLLINLEALSRTQFGRLMDTTDGTLMFEWEAGGTERDRTMFVREFRGVLSRLEDENIIRFETEITDAGFDISDTRKIR